MVDEWFKQLPFEAEIHFEWELKWTWICWLYPGSIFIPFLKFQQTGFCQFIQLSFKNKSWGFQGSPLLYFLNGFSVWFLLIKVNPTPSKVFLRSVIDLVTLNWMGANGLFQSFQVYFVWHLFSTSEVSNPTSTILVSFFFKLHACPLFELPFNLLHTFLLSYFGIIQSTIFLYLLGNK